MSADDKMITLRQQNGVFKALSCQPPANHPMKGGLLLLPEMWGVDEFAKSVAERYAAYGYQVLVPDVFSGTTLQKLLTSELKEKSRSPSLRMRREVQPQLQNIVRMIAAPQFTYMALMRIITTFTYLHALPAVREKVCVVGFDLGGSYAYSLAMREQRLRCAVAFYGQTNYIEPELRHIACPVLGLYGGKDQARSELALRLQRRMYNAGVNFELQLYNDASSGFFDHTNQLTYDDNAADQAWAHVMGFLEHHMYRG
jgi:carboxymethylenebutenolidase